MKHLNEFLFFHERKLNEKIMQLESSLQAFSQITQVPVSFYSSAGKFCWAATEQKRFCDSNMNFGSEETACTGNLLSAMKISLSLPEPYIFMCGSGLINLCYALILKDRPHGFFIAGPVAMGNDLLKTLHAFTGKSSAEKLDYDVLFPLIKSLKLYSPKEITALTTLFHNTLTAALSELESAAERTARSQHYEEQSLISQKLIRMKKEHLEVEYPRRSELRLTGSIKAGDTSGCLRYFSKYIEDIMVFEGGNLALTRLRLVAFITQLLRSDLQWQKSYDALYLLEKINNAQTLKEIMEAGKKLIMSLTKSSASTVYAGSSQIVKKAVDYLNTHYCEDITLKQAAKALHVNSSYLSTLFKEEMEISFTAFLNQLRLNHSEELLRSTSLTVTQICLETGFSSASYFIKLFKEKHGITPKEFRTVK